MNEPKQRIVNAMFSSIWDGGTQILTTCRVNLDTKEVFDIKRVEDCDVDVLDSQHINLFGESYEVTPESELEDEACKNEQYWFAD